MIDYFKAKAVPFLVALSIIMTCAAFWFMHRLNAVSDKLVEAERTTKTTATARKADGEALAHRDKTNAATAREMASARASAAAAVASNPEWAEQPLPADIQELLNADE